MQKICGKCSHSFEIDQSDLDFYHRISPLIAGQKRLVPAPSLCPLCRLQRRLAFHNLIFVYPQRSGFSGNKLISMWTSDVPFPVYDNEEWWGDSWDACVLGRDFSSQQSFFEQFQSLRQTVPHYSRSMISAENCPYANNFGYCKNCYMVFDADYSQDCFYGETIVRCNNCFDCTTVFDSELCYDCVHCKNCFQLQSSQECSDCRDSYYLWGCRSCHDCFACTNLRHKQYCFFNQQLSAAEYRKKLSQIELHSFSGRKQIEQQVLALWRSEPRPNLFELGCEDVSGNGIYHSKKVHDSFYVEGSEDCRYCYRIKTPTKNCYDLSFFGIQAELLYECVHSGLNSQNLLFCHLCWGNCCNLIYCVNCVESQDCFGCVGLYKKRFCVLNKQYNADDYHALVAQIIERMRLENTWGEFFPMHLSPHPYNHSTAFRHFPLSQEQAVAAGLIWYQDPERNLEQFVDAIHLPDLLPEHDSSYLVKSSQSGKPYKITLEEVKYLRRMGLPLPRQSYDERMLARAARMGDVRLYPTMCSKTGVTMLTSFPLQEGWTLWEKEAFRIEFDR